MSHRIYINISNFMLCQRNDLRYVYVSTIILPYNFQKKKIKLPKYQ